jgi:hypothetical protein
MSGKNDFYPVVEESFKAKGYEYFDGDRDINGKTAQHRRTGGRNSLTTGENLPVYVQMCWTAKKPVSLIRKSEDTKL